MTDPTLTGGTSFLTSASTTLTLYGTQSEDFNKSANLITLTLPAQDSDTTIAFDALGVTKEIQIQGIFVETTAPVTVLNFTADLNTLIRGSQGDTGGGTVGYTYTPVSITATQRVYVNDVKWTYVAGEPSKIAYSLTLVQVSSTSG